MSFCCSNKHRSFLLFIFFPVKSCQSLYTKYRIIIADILFYYCKACKDTFSFKHVLATFPNECRAAVPKDISPHLCFICLLHLANAHSLSIYDCPTLDDLTIHLPSSCASMLTHPAIEASS